MPTVNVHWLFALLLLLAFAAIALREPAQAPSALVEADTAARQQLAAAQGRISAATAAAAEIDRARIHAAISTEQAFMLTIRAGDATRQAQSHNATATMDAVAFAATMDARRAAATAQALDTQATAAAYALAQEKAIAEVTRQAQYAAIALERERTWTTTANAILSLIAICVGAAFMVTLYWLSRAIDARYTVYRWAKAPPGAVLILGTSQTNWVARTPAPAPANIIPNLPPQKQDGATVAVPPLPPDLDRELVLSLLDESIAEFGGNADQIMPAGRSRLASEAWQKATKLLVPYIVSGRGREGTHLAFTDYPTLVAMRDGIESGAAVLGQVPPSPAAVMSANNLHSTHSTPDAHAHA